MTFHITIFGPVNGEKLVLMFDSRYQTVSRDIFKEHFSVGDSDFYLMPLVLYGGAYKLYSTCNDSNELVFFLHYEKSQFYKAIINKESIILDLAGTKSASSFAFSNTY